MGDLWNTSLTCFLREIVPSGWCSFSSPSRLGAHQLCALLPWDAHWALSQSTLPMILGQRKDSCYTRDTEVP